MCEVTDSSGRHRDRYGKDSLLREYHPVINQNLVTLTWTAYQMTSHVRASVA